MAVYTHLTEDELADLVKGYDIGSLDFAVGIAEGVENSNYLLECDRDGEKTKYILTVYEKRVNPNDLPFFIGLMQHLHEHGFDSPMPVANKQGECIGEVDGKPFAIVSFVNGRSRTTFKSAHLKELGSAIGKMHNASQGFELSRHNDLQLKGWVELYDGIAAQLDTIEPGLKELAAKELAFLEKAWPNTLPRGIIHADLFPDNVFFKGERVSGVIDFYFACEDMLAYELAICLNCWCFEVSNEFNITKAGKMIRAYHSERPLLEEEKEALPILARGAALRFFLTRAHDWIHHDEAALVTPKNPIEYAKKLVFHQGVKSIAEYGMLS